MDILGICEIRWKEEDDFRSREYRKGQAGLGVSTSTNIENRMHNLRNP